MRNHTTTSGRGSAAAKSGRGPFAPVVRVVRVVPALLVFLFAGAGVPAAPGPEAAAGTDPEAARLVERIEQWSRAHPHFEARFEQRFRPRIFGRERVEGGRLTIRRPGRMRFDYETPEPKVFVSDGTNTWFHVPADRQVVVGAFAPEADGPEGDGELPPNPLDFLSGAARITDFFEAEIAADDDRGGLEDAADGLQALALTARRPDRGPSALTLLVEAASGRIHGIASEDLEGNRTEFRFSDFRVGDPPDDSLFTFRIPPGTEVLTASGAAGAGR